MEHEPKIEQCAEQPYAGIPAEVESEAEFRQAVDRSFPELFGWLGSHGITPAGPPFIRYLELSGEGQPALRARRADRRGARRGRARACRHAPGRPVPDLPPRRPYTHAEVADLNDARSLLSAWAEREGIGLESSPTPRGTAYAANVEHYLTDASREADWSKWQTELACLIASA